MAARRFGIPVLLALAVATVGVLLVAEARANHAIEDWGKYYVAFDSSRQAVEVIGAFLPGISEQVRQQLNDHPEARAVHLTSPGGLIVEGRQLHALIYSRGIDTVVRSYCVSACTLAFVGGKQRVVYRNAIIGFHQYGGFRGESLRDSWQDVDRSFFRGRGVADDFADKMFQAEFDELWQLTADQAVEAKVATRKAQSLDAPPDSFYPAQALQALHAGQGGFAPLYAVLQRYEPAGHREAITNALDSIVSDDAPEAIGKAGLDAAVSAYRRLLPITSNEAARAVAKAFSALLDDVRKSGTKACLAFLESDSEILRDEDFNNPYRPATLVQLANAYAGVIRDAHEHPQPRLSPDARERALEGFDEILADSEFADDLELLGNEKRYRQEPDRACATYRQLFTLLAQQPPEKGGLYWRAVMDDEDE